MLDETHCRRCIRFAVMLQRALLLVLDGRVNKQIASLGQTRLFYTYPSNQPPTCIHTCTSRRRKRQARMLPKSIHSFIHSNRSILNNSLQLPRIPNRILNHLSARHQDLLLVPHTLPLLQGEIDSAVPHHPTSPVRKLHHAAFALEEEEVLGVGDGKGRVGFF